MLEEWLIIVQLKGMLAERQTVFLAIGMLEERPTIVTPNVILEGPTIIQLNIMLKD